MCKKNFDTFKLSFKISSSTYHDKVTLEEAKKDQYKMLKQLKSLEKYNPKNQDKVNSGKETLINVKNNRQKVIKAFETGIFAYIDRFLKKGPDVSDEALPDWVKVDKKRFTTIKNNVKRVSNKNRFILPGGAVLEFC